MYILLSIITIPSKWNNELKKLDIQIILQNSYPCTLWIIFLNSFRILVIITNFSENQYPFLQQNSPTVSFSDSKLHITYQKPKKEWNKDQRWDYFPLHSVNIIVQTSIRIARSTTMLVTYPRTKWMILLATDEEPISTSICMV